ncbi:hypothetical protein P7C71_g1011, partial [Lecanoromycetidae sp. Uapishka_2]
MDLHLILNPVAESSQATTITDKAAESSQATSVTENEYDTDETVSEASASFDDGGYRTPIKHHTGSSNTIPSNVPSVRELAQQADFSPIILSPNKGSIYTRRASTSPTRVPVLQSPKRRRSSYYRTDEPPPPTHETNINRFSVFNKLLNYAELTLEVAKNLDIEDLVSIYAISKDFHMLVNQRFTAMILAQSTTKAPESSKTFIWRCYKSLCMRDPARRINEVHPSDLRFIPSFRWLKMILFREAIVNDILRSLAYEGHRLPRRASLVIKKLWFTIDISDNNRRIGLLHNANFWTSKDLFIATMFFLKLDMRLTHPTSGNGETGLRKMLLAQRSFSTLAKVLRREEMKTQLDMLRMVVRYNYQPRRHRDMSILGVPPHEVGKLQFEGWGMGTKKFIPIDRLVMLEGLRRKLNLQNLYVDMMLYGYVNKRTWEDIKRPVPPPEPKVEETEDEGEEDWETSSESDEDSRKGKGKGKGKEKATLFDDDTEDEEGDGGDEGEAEDMDVDAYAMNFASGDQGSVLGEIEG